MRARERKALPRRFCTSQPCILLFLFIKSFTLLSRKYGLQQLVDLKQIQKPLRTRRAILQNKERRQDSRIVDSQMFAINNMTQSILKIFLFQENSNLFQIKRIRGFFQERILLLFLFEVNFFLANFYLQLFGSAYQPLTLNTRSNKISLKLNKEQNDASYLKKSYNFNRVRLKIIHILLIIQSSINMIIILLQFHFVELIYQQTLF